MSGMPLLRLAASNLRHGGQRLLVALLCITFGVMSLVSMSLLTDAITESIMADGRERLGGDLQLSRHNQRWIDESALAELDSLKARGELEEYTVRSSYFSLALRRPGSGRLIFVQGEAVDTERFPLAGSMVLATPANVGYATLLQEEGDLLLTRDLAEGLDLAPGDEVVLSDMGVGAPVMGRIRGILADTPGHQGRALFFNLGTAATLSQREFPATYVNVLTASPDLLETTLEESGWWVYSVAQQEASQRDARDLFNLLLKGAGILGLLVGGIGIANTMQVVLARRTREIAVLKTVGYRQVDLLQLFLFETALLGGAGSLLGVLLALLLSRWLVVLFGRTTTYLFDYSYSGSTLVLGFMVGVVTTLIFATYAIVRTSTVRPAALLRNEPLTPTKTGRAASIALVLLLAVPFVLTTTVVMGSLLSGIGIVLFAMAGLLALGGVLGASLWVVQWLLGLSRAPLVGLARNTLHRRLGALVLAMIALFTGIVTLSLAGVVTGGAQREYAARQIEMGSVALFARAAVTEEAALGDAFASVGVEPIATGYDASVSAIRVNGEPLSGVSPILRGRTSPVDLSIQGAPWGSKPRAVYIPSFSEQEPPGEVEVLLNDGSTHRFPVAGTYQPDFRNPTVLGGNGLLMDVALLRTITEPDTVLFMANPPLERLDAATMALGEALPSATVINSREYLDRFSESYHNLFVLAVAMSGLALLAGVLLVANAVSLAMLDRRYELGVLKAIGYTRRHLLATVAIEYTVVGALASLLALVVVHLFLLISQESAALIGTILTIDLPMALLLLAISVALTVATALLAAWRPLHVSPLVLLNERVA